MLVSSRCTGAGTRTPGMTPKQLWLVHYRRQCIGMEARAALPRQLHAM